MRAKDRLLLNQLFDSALALKVSFANCLTLALQLLKALIILHVAKKRELLNLSALLPRPELKRFSGISFHDI